MLTELKSTVNVNTSKIKRHRLMKLSENTPYAKFTDHANSIESYLEKKFNQVQIVHTQYLCSFIFNTTSIYPRLLFLHM